MKKIPLLKIIAFVMLLFSAFPSSLYADDDDSDDSDSYDSWSSDDSDDSDDDEGDYYDSGDDESDYYDDGDDDDDLNDIDWSDFFTDDEDTTYNVPNGDGGFDTISYSDVFDDDGNFIYDYTGPGDKSEAEEVIAEMFGGYRNDDNSNSQGYLSMYIEAIQALEEAKKSGEDLDKIEDLEFAVSVTKGALDAYCNSHELTCTVNDSKQFAVVTNKEGKTVCHVGDPVVFASGDFVIDDLDMSARGRTSVFYLKRHYSSGDEAQRDVPAGIFGKGWTSNIESRIIRGREEVYDGVLEDWETYLAALDPYAEEIAGYVEEDGECQSVYDQMLAFIEEEKAKVELIREKVSMNELVRNQNRYVSYGLACEYEANAGFDTIFYIQDDGGIILFRKEEDSSYKIISQNRNIRIELEDWNGGFCVTYPVTGEKRYYSELGLPIYFTFRNGGRIDFAYDENMRISQVLVDGFRKITFAWNGKNLSQARDEGSGEKVSYGYEGTKLSCITDFDGDSRYYAYNSDGLLSRQIKADGSYVSFEYAPIEGRFRTVATVDETGSRESFSYELSERRTTYTDKDGLRQIFTYDQLGRTLSVRAESGRDDVEDRLSLYEYDSDGFLVAEEKNGEKIEYGYDSLGNIVEKKYADGKSESWTYDEYLLKSYTDKDGKTYSYNYDSLSRLTDIYSGQELVFHFDYNYYGLISGRRDSSDRQVDFYYDYDANLTERVLHTGGTIKREFWSYDSQDRLTSYTDVLGRKSTFSYSAHGKTALLYNGLKIEEEYSPRKLLVKRTETDTHTGEKRVHSYNYDRAKKCTGEYISGTDSFGSIYSSVCLSTMEYRPSGKLASFIEYDVFDDIKNSFSTEFTYDSFGDYASALSGFYARPSSASSWVYSYPLSSYRENPYSICASPRTSYRTNAGIIEIEYDLLGRIISKKVRESDGRTVSEEEWRYGDRKISHISGGKYREEFFFNAFSELTAYVDGEGNRTEFFRDLLGRVFMEKDPYGSVTAFTYNGRNQLESVTLPDGSRIEYEYDGRGNCISACDAQGELWRNYYDYSGRLSSFTERPFRLSYDYFYDSYGTVSDLRVNGKSERRVSYSNGKSECRVSDSLGNVNTYRYDAYGNLSSWENSLGEKSEFKFNYDGSLDFQKDFNGSTKKFSYDMNSKKITCSDGNIFLYKYDCMGNLLEAKSAGSQLFFCYDRAGLLVSQHDGNPENEVSFSYNQAKQLVKISSKDRQLAYLRGKNGEVLEITDVLTSGGVSTKTSVRFVYDKCGRESLRVYDSGESLKSFYDKSGRKILRVGYSAEMNPVFVDGLVFNKKGELICSLDSSFQIRTYSYDSRGRLASVSYPYSEEMIKKMKSEIAEAGVFSLENSERYARLELDSETFKNLQNLCSLISPGAYQPNLNETVVIENYDYDSNSNIIRKTNPFGSIDYSYDSENRLVSWGNDGKASYDANGNMISKTDRFCDSRYDYNSEKRITGIYVHDRVNDKVYMRKFSYDALGRRCDSWANDEGKKKNSYIGLGMYLFSSKQDFSDSSGIESVHEEKVRVQKNENASSGRYVFIGENQPSEKTFLERSLPSAGNIHPLYDYDGKIMSFFSSGESGGHKKNVLMTDYCGNVRTEISDYGMISQYSYDSFGLPVSDFGEFAFGGKTFDPKSELYDFGFRDYVPKYARFSSVDPIHDGTNWYAYCDGNPVEFYDLSGLKSVKMDEQFMQDMGHIFLGTSSSEYADLEGCLVTAIAESLSALTGVPVSNDYINSLQACFNGGYISWDGVLSTFGLTKNTEFTAKAPVTQVKENPIISAVNNPKSIRGIVDYCMNNKNFDGKKGTDGFLAIFDINNIKSTLESIERSGNSKAVLAQVNYDGKHLHFVGIGTEVKVIGGQQVVAVTATSKFDTSQYLGGNRKGQGWIVDRGQVYIPITLINRIDAITKAQ